MGNDNNGVKRRSETVGQRRERLAAELRANLMKRKSLARARARGERPNGTSPQANGETEGTAGDGKEGLN